jgi:hypothetical protein
MVFFHSTPFPGKTTVRIQTMCKTGTAEERQG